MKTIEIEISKIKHNTGQIDGLPSNPRTIKDEPYEALLQSIKEDPEMLELRPIIVFPLKNQYIVIGGNKRFSAIKDLKYKKAPCIVLPKTTTIEKLKAITIKDNISAGEWDFEALRLDWDEEQLKSWGLDMPIVDEGGADEELADISDKLQPQFKIEVVCKSEEEQEKTYNKLIEAGYECRILTL
jgi:ParB-like chromosome segregation protein Spo0J